MSETPPSQVSPGPGSPGSDVLDGASRAAAMFTPTAAMDPLERALSYPYAAPAHSYIYREGAAHPARIGSAERADRIPVLACGSNRAPAQLGRKFAGIDGAVVPVERVFLADFDSVYAAHVSGYGAIAATLQHSPGCRVELFVTWLAESLMPRMHATEGRGHFYDFVRLEGLDLESEGGDRLDAAFAYNFRGGCLNLGGAETAVAAVPAEGRRYRALDERAVQEEVRRKIEPRMAFEDFVLEAVRDPERRLAREARLGVDAIPFRWPSARVIAAA